MGHTVLGASGLFMLEMVAGLFGKAGHTDIIIFVVRQQKYENILDVL